jgi:hypothetical protein
MSRIYSKKRALIGVVASLAIAAVAIAYWTAGGSGTGSASAQGAQQPLTAAQTTVLSAMYPGDSPQTISGTVTNPNTAKIRVANVVASIQSVTKADGAPAGTCDASDFSLTDATMAVNDDVNGSNGTKTFSGAKIQFNNKPAANQDACKGATVTLAYAIS